ncbi:MAG: 50S ribosomal protein L10 [Rickettsiales bacterium]|nr:50S ribosomal protein L10 [Pseudomonadota bacterium]MDA0967143.1 50S ribosomal protein L10 [Pseudomonadota bacterium]MDG4544328.1 50S ribosomal protein L10 [Rickettsiales bacterium]MDG4546458.1 50S ribosomal protein L10 [Rickettsiales bacterium]MDG4548604.1 50S ribosomal protein L10 [Rickettsiales bacterium]
MDRVEKKQTVESLNAAFADANTFVITHYMGLTVEEITQLRRNLSSLGGNFRVTKNRLAKLALKGTQYESLADRFVGPTAVAYSDDPVAAAKGVVEFAKNNEKLVIIGGAIGNKQIDVNEINSLAKLPSLDELRAKIVGMINTPATRIAGVVQAPAGQIARVLNARSQQAE